jgi:flagellar hook-associated protein 2
MAAFSFGTITSQGVGSNLNVAGIVSELMQIERAPLDRLIAKKNSYDAKISALGSIKSSLSSFQSALAGLTTGTNLQANKATSTNTSIVTATGGSGAVAGNYSVEVTKLAHSQKLVAAGQADSTATIGGGSTTTLTIDLGTISGGTFDSGTGTYTGASYISNGTTVDVTIDSSNNTLEGIRDAINSANAGVKATIINDGDPTNPYRLVLSSENSGADQSIKITVAGDATLNTLLGQDPAGTQNLSETVTAQDAQLTVDGIAITKSSNSITDVISGVTLDLITEAVGTNVTVAVSQDTDTAKSAVETFVQAYNDLLSEINTQTDSGYSGNTAGALASDTATRQIVTFIKNELNQTPTGVSGSYNTLSSIGVSFQRDGTLALDESKLSAAIESDSQNVADLFSSADGYATRLDTVVSDLLASNGTIDLRTSAFEDRISTLEDQEVTLQGRLDRTEARLRAQFTNLDVLISNLTTTSNYLTQQLSILNAQTSGG